MPVQTLSMTSLRLLALTLLALILSSCQASPDPVATGDEPADSSPSPDDSESEGLGDGTPRHGGTLVFAVERESGELDIHNLTVGTTRQYARGLYNTLFRSDAVGNFSGELVESWEIVEPTEYLFNLRQGVKFHDGTDWNAEALIFNLERVRDEGLYAPDLSGIEEMAVVDDSTVKITLSAPDATFIARLVDGAGWVVSPAAVEKYGEDFATNPVGTGPFKFVEWVPDSQLVLERNDDYWDTDEEGRPLPYLDSVIFRPIPDASVMLTGLRTGELDLIERLDVNQVDSIRDDPELELSDGPGYRMVIMFNHAAEPFSSRPLREAVNFAIDRDAIHEGIYRGTGLPSYSLLHPTSWAFTPDSPVHSYDPDEARAKLSEAGMPNGFEFTILANNNPEQLPLATAVQAQLAEVGITMNIEALEGRIVTERSRAGDFDARILNSAPPPDPSLQILPYLYTGASVNSGKYSNPDLDALLDEALSMTEQEPRAQLYQQVQEIMVEDATYAPLHNNVDAHVMRSDVRGYEHVATPVGYIYLDRFWLDR